MTKVNLVFPHQLFASGPLINNGFPIYLVEEFLFFRHYRFHKQKILFHRASMKAYERDLEERQIPVHYINSYSKHCDIRSLVNFLSCQGVKEIHYIDPTDDWLSKRINASAKRNRITSVKYESPLFLNTAEDLKSFFNPARKQYLQATFYRAQRKKYLLLITENGQPAGGQWSYDSENRKKYPAGKQSPKVRRPLENNFHEEARDYVEQYFSNNPGAISDVPLYPIDRTSSLQWMDEFLDNRFQDFGDYEDAIVSDELVLHHSVMSPILNTGLVSIREFIDKIVAYTKMHEIGINSTEGLIRQLIGWREFIRGIYEFHGSDERTRNYWNFHRKIPDSFYQGNTGITPLDITIKKVLQNAYCHHIERLMVIGNFMLLCEFHPDEVYRWFMELFIDSYDWVMVPNVYGMSQFADGGLFATKPYISGSNYINKMSDFKKGSWEEIWDALFWRFLHTNRDFFLNNPRLKMLVGTFDKMPENKQRTLLNTAEQYLSNLR